MHEFERVMRQIADERRAAQERWMAATDAYQSDPSEENRQAVEAATTETFGDGLYGLKEQREAKADRLITAALTDFHESRSMDASTFGTLLAYVGCVHGPQALFHLDHFNAIEPGAYAAIVPDVWGMAEYPGMSMSRADWRRLWKKAGYVGDGEYVERPTKPVTVYRASFPAYKGNMSWTDDLSRAKWFQKARGERSRLYQTTAPPERLLARIHEEGRGEFEWVVDTRSLTIEEID